MNCGMSKGNELCTFGNIPFEPKERETIQELLRSDTFSKSNVNNNILPGYSKSLPLSSSYLLANNIFKFNGWSDRIINLNVDFIEQDMAQWSVGVTAIVRVVLKDGSFHENIGFAEAKSTSKGTALREAKTRAVEIARLRCLQVFGECFTAINSQLVESETSSSHIDASSNDRNGLVSASSSSVMEVISSQPIIPRNNESKGDSNSDSKSLYEPSLATPETPESPKDQATIAVDQGASISQSMLDVLSNIEEFDKIEAEVQGAVESPSLPSSAPVAIVPPSFKTILPHRNEALPQNPTVASRGQTYGLTLPANQSIPVQNGLSMKRNNTFISCC